MAQRDSDANKDIVVNRSSALELFSELEVRPGFKLD